MNKRLVKAMTGLFVAMLAGSSNAIAAKPIKPPPPEPRLEGPVEIGTDGQPINTEVIAAEQTYFPRYGDYVGFYQRDVLLTNNQRSYVTVLCTQNGTYVYQVSQWGSELLVFPLTDPGSSLLEWHEGGALCTATLIINEQKGKSITITPVDQIEFVVLD